jgi:hypothetical protein
MIDPDKIGGNRLDNTTFQHLIEPPTEDGVAAIRMSISGIEDGDLRYRLVNSIQQLFREKIGEVTRKNLEHGIIAEIDDPALAGKWLITSRKVGCLFFRILESIIYRIKQCFPFLYTPPSESKINVTVINISGSRSAQLAAKIAGATSFLHVLPAEGIPDSARSLPLPKTSEQIIKMPAFGDPATRLSRLCLQTVDGPYVMEAQPQSNYYLAIDGGNLILRRIPENKDSSYFEANRKAVQYYVGFLKHEFGLDFLTQIQRTSSIDFGKMIDEGSPLTPDVVSRCNVCANNIEMPHLENLWRRLCILASRFANICEGLDQDFVWSGPKSNSDIRDYILPWRVMRKLIAGRDRHEVMRFVQDLAGFAPPHSVRDLPPEKFNAIRALFESTPEELDRAYTGRKITHIAISGTNTMGDPNAFNPCRYQAELLQIFGGLQRNWDNFIELTAHVFSKKNLFRFTSDQRRDEWHVGTIIPGPIADNGQSSSFLVQALADDGQGSFSYVLEPACNTYTLNGRQLPFLKVYRSTNSNPNSPGWWTSVLADLNSKGSPGSMDPDSAYKKERAALDKRSLPVWSGYVEAARMLSSNSSLSTLTYAQALTLAVAELDQYLKMIEPEACVGLIGPLRRELECGHFSHVERSLHLIAERYRERPCDKLAQDTFHIGHSLGASNAQLFTWHHFAKQRRIPMIGCGSYTVAFNGPAIDQSEDEEFMSLREHKELFRLLNIHFSVTHQLEYGDIVPQAGRRHLGTSGYTDEDASWLHFNAYVFKPNIYERPYPAKALPIVTLQTHGRRIQEAVEGPAADYVRTPVTPHQLVEFHDSWWLPGDLRTTFGFSLLNSPLVSEKVRCTAGKIFSPLGKFISPFIEIGEPSRSHDDVTYIAYQPNMRWAF